MFWAVEVITVISLVGPELEAAAEVGKELELSVFWAAEVITVVSLVCPELEATTEVVAAPEALLVEELLRIPAATPSSAHPTYTPIVLFIGTAAQVVPWPHTSITKLLSELQFPVLPEIHAIWPGVHDEEKLRVEKKEL